MSTTKGLCRDCLRVVPATATTNPFGNVRLNDHYVFPGGVKKLCAGSGRVGRPVGVVENHAAENGVFGLPVGAQRVYKSKLFDIEEP